MAPPGSVDDGSSGTLCPVTTYLPSDLQLRDPLKFNVPTESVALHSKFTGATRPPAMVMGTGSVYRHLFRKAELAIPEPCRGQKRVLIDGGDKTDIATVPERERYEALIRATIAENKKDDRDAGLEMGLDILGNHCVAFMGLFTGDNDLQAVAKALYNTYFRDFKQLWIMAAGGNPNNVLHKMRHARMIAEFMGFVKPDPIVIVEADSRGYRLQNGETGTWDDFRRLMQHLYVQDSDDFGHVYVHFELGGERTADEIALLLQIKRTARIQTPAGVRNEYTIGFDTVDRTGKRGVGVITQNISNDQLSIVEGILKNILIADPTASFVGAGHFQLTEVMKRLLKKFGRNMIASLHGHLHKRGLEIVNQGQEFQSPEIGVPSIVDNMQMTVWKRELQNGKIRHTFKYLTLRKEDIPGNGPEVDAELATYGVEYNGLLPHLQARNMIRNEEAREISDADVDLSDKVEDLFDVNRGLFFAADRFADTLSGDDLIFTSIHFKQQYFLEWASVMKLSFAEASQKNGVENFPGETALKTDFREQADEFLKAFEAYYGRTDRFFQNIRRGSFPEDGVTDYQRQDRLKRDFTKKAEALSQKIQELTRKKSPLPEREKRLLASVLPYVDNMPSSMDTTLSKLRTLKTLLQGKAPTAVRAAQVNAFDEPYFDACLKHTDAGLVLDSWANAFLARAHIIAQQLHTRHYKEVRDENVPDVITFDVDPVTGKRDNITQPLPPYTQADKDRIIERLGGHQIQGAEAIQYKDGIRPGLRSYPGKVHWLGRFSYGVTHPFLQDGQSVRKHGFSMDFGISYDLLAQRGARRLFSEYTVGFDTTSQRGPQVRLTLVPLSWGWGTMFDIGPVVSGLVVVPNSDSQDKALVGGEIGGRLNAVRTHLTLDVVASCTQEPVNRKIECVPFFRLGPNMFQWLRSVTGKLRDFF